MSNLTASIKELEKVNKQLAKLNLVKEQLTEEIIGSFGHEHEGQRTYEHESWKIEIRTPVIYSLNKKLYESGDVKLPLEFDPVKESISYTIDKRLCDEYMETAPKNIKVKLIELIEKKPGKPGVTIKARI